MLTAVRIKAQSFFYKGHERTNKVKKNIIYSFLLKGISIIIGFVLIPMTIGYVNTYEYGIWLTLSSIIGWFNFFDIGLGNGLKNKLAEANALGETKVARIYVSTTYAILLLISFALIGLFWLLTYLINWSKVLNVSNNVSVDLHKVVFLVFGFFCFQFVSQLINTVLTALHSPAKVSVNFLLSQFLSVLILFVLTRTTNGSLLVLVLVLAGAPVLTQVLASFWFFSREYKAYAPGFRYVDFKYARELFRIGGVFFVIQIGALVLFQTDNIVITQLFGPEKVTTFNVAFRLFNSIIMAFSIVITPFWSAFTDAFAKEDHAWMQRVLKKLHRYWSYFGLLSLLVFIFSPWIYKLWLKNKVDVPISLSLVMAFYVIVHCWQTVHVFLLNGIGKIRLQLLLVVISAIINIPLAILFSKWFGLPGVTLANMVLFIGMGIAFSIQCKKLLNNTASGIWKK